MKRVIVIGCPGSGKTTFAEKTNKITGLPIYHLDAIWHKPDKTLDEIAYEVGYRSYSGFELCFKRYFGIIPTKKRTQILAERKQLL